MIALIVVAEATVEFAGILVSSATEAEEFLVP